MVVADIPSLLVCSETDTTMLAHTDDPVIRILPPYQCGLLPIAYQDPVRWHPLRATVCAATQAASSTALT
jgi:hypothetical protein